MKAKLLPSDILLARLSVHEYRAWSRCWSQSLAGLFEGGDQSSDVKWFCDLTGSQENEVRDSRRRARSRDEFLDVMVQRWCRDRGSAPTSGRGTCLVAFWGWSRPRISTQFVGTRSIGSHGSLRFETSSRQTF
jgi:hypothetical protein